jgi:hypothetical protein
MAHPHFQHGFRYWMILLLKKLLQPFQGWNLVCLIIQKVWARLWEIKIFYGPGIRVYYGKRGHKIILLWGGTKNMQSNDISRANNYWLQYLKQEESITWH